MTECRVQIRPVGGLIETWIALILPGRKLRSCPTLLANQPGTSVHHLRCYKVQLPTKSALLFEYENRSEESSLLWRVGFLYQTGRLQLIQYASYIHINLQAPHKATDLGVAPLQCFVLLGAILSSFVRTR